MREIAVWMWYLCGAMLAGAIVLAIIGGAISALVALTEWGIEQRRLLLKIEVAEAELRRIEQANEQHRRRYDALNERTMMYCTERDKLTAACRAQEQTISALRTQLLDLQGRLSRTTGTSGVPDRDAM